MRVARPTLPILLILACCGSAAGQARDDRAQLPVYRGRVERFTLASRGEVDGLLLTDGTEVETPPRLSDQVAAAVRPGDAVAIRGLRAASLPLIRAVTILGERTGRTVVDRGLADAPDEPAPVDATPARHEGRIRTVLHGPRGDVNGLLLDDGTTIRIDPIEIAQVPPAYTPGRLVVAEGEALTSAYGTVIRATAIAPPPARDGRP